MITFGDFEKLDIRIGEIKSCEKVEGSEKLLKIIIDAGEEERQILAGIAPFYGPEELIGKQVPFIANLEPKRMAGAESRGMMLVADAEKPVFLVAESKIPNGTKVR